MKNPPKRDWRLPTAWLDWLKPFFGPEIPLRPYRVIPRRNAYRFRRRLLRGILKDLNAIESLASAGFPARENGGLEHSL